MTIKVAIADDHPMIIDGVQNTLSRYSHVDLIAMYSNGEELLKGLQQKVPDVLLLDIQLPDRTGDELAPIIIKKYPDIKIVALTNFDSTLYANNMLKRGVQGFLVKTANKNMLIQAIETVYNGNEFIEKSMKKRLVHFDIKNTTFSKATLTQREKEVLQMLANGNSAPEIAAKLFLGLGTVINYRTNIMLKLDAKNTAMLIKKALQLGLAE